MTKEEKREYDKKYRDRNKELLKAKKRKYWHENKEAIKAKRRVRRDNDEARKRHAEYCRHPEQRHKEKIRRYIREGKTGVKTCLKCQKSKGIMNFECWLIMPEKRHYLCKECEKQDYNELGISTRYVITAMVNRRYTRLKRKDIGNNPYLIEANKYLILLKRLTQ